MAWNKKNFQFSDFCFQIPAHLIDLLEKILPILSATEGTEITEKLQRHKFTPINLDSVFLLFLFLA